MNMVNFKVNNMEVSYPEGTLYEAVARDFEKDYSSTIALVNIDGEIKELHKKVKEGISVSFETLSDNMGYRAYVRTAILLLVSAYKKIAGGDCFPSLKVEFLIGNGYYCDVDKGIDVTEEFVARIEAKMHEMIASKQKITKKRHPINDARQIFARQGMDDKNKFLKFRRFSTVNIYEIDGYYDYYFGGMLPNVSYITDFELRMYNKGILLVLPEQKNINNLEEFKQKDKFFATLSESDGWGKAIGIDTVGDLNEQICQGKIQDIILLQEALQESKIGEIARKIKEKEKVKFVLIAGPSSSGKTTFSHRLSTQLRSIGLIPHTIGMDDYFVDRSITPRHEDGSYNFETVEALDYKKFNEDMIQLVKGEKVDMPSYNFVAGQREYKGKTMQLGENDILVIEGIHGLNPKMSAQLDDEYKFKIYISALTVLNIDSHNRIPTADVRLLRRIVRDARTRGMDAAHTIAMWKSVRSGEENYIFPYQEEVDMMFNSAAIYELAALKIYVEPLLLQIEKDDPCYNEAKRLLKFLEFLVAFPSEIIPNHAIIREFIGGSYFLN